MVFKGLIAAATAVALATAPTVAAANNSAALARAAVVAPATESVKEGSEAMKEDGIFEGGFIIPFFAIVFIGLGLYFAFFKKNKRGRVSP